MATVYAVLLGPLQAAWWQTTDEAEQEQGNALIDNQQSPIKVNVSGASGELADNIKAYMPSLRSLDCNSDKDSLERFIDASADNLLEGAEAMGYFSARFNTTASRQGDCWVLNIAVEPGEPIRVSQIKIQVSGEGESLQTFRKLEADPPYRPGDVLISGKYEDFKSSLTSAANRLGFFDARV
ncbi:MAG: POTRA domain-containing protein [Thiolinea sp.]